MAIPTLAEQVRQHRRADLESRTGRLMALFFCSRIIAAPADDADPLRGPAQHEAARLVEELHR